MKNNKNYDNIFLIYMKTPIFYINIRRLKHLQWKVQVMLLAQRR